MSLPFRVSILFLLAFLWFAAFQPWGAFRDPDAFYHAKIAALLLEHGPVRAFPWLDLTTLGSHFADQHFLFHVLLLPFVRIFGALAGTQLASVCFAALFIVVLYLVLHRLRTSSPELWTFLALTSSMLVLRLSLAKASPIALIWFVLGLFAIARRKPWIGCVAALGFALSHGGWIILLGSQALFLIGDGVFERALMEKRWRASLAATAWPVLGWSILGAALGMLLHPNFPETISFLWVQVVKIGLGTPFDRVTLGSEWLPFSVGDLFTTMGPYAIAAVLLLFGLVFARRVPLDLARARDVIAFGFPIAALLALTFKSQRMAEYFIPALTLWFASLASLIDPKRFWEEITYTGQRIGGRFAKGVPFLCALMAVGVLVPGLWQTKEGLSTFARPFDLFEAPMRVLAQEATPGERIFHTDWDEFPILFFRDDRFRYVSGLDPTFLLDAHPELSDAYRDITLGHVTSGVASRIREQFDSRFVFIDRDRHEALVTVLRNEPTVTAIYEDARVLVYKLR